MKRLAVAVQATLLARVQHTVLVRATTTATGHTVFWV